MARAVGLAALMFMVGAAIPTRAASETAALVTVRTYNYAFAPAAYVIEAQDEVIRIFKNAGITLQWLECSIEPFAEHVTTGCMDPLRQGQDLILRLTSGTPGPPAGRVLALGASMLDHGQGGGVLMTVDVLPIRTIAERSATGGPTLLGRAIAHEMGHLLLGTSTHPKDGLMRALWSHDELRGAKPAHWGFSSREARQMRDGLRGRVPSAN